MKHAIASVLSFMLYPAIAYAQPYSEYGHMWNGWGWGHFLFGSVMMVAFWAGIIVVIVLLLRRVGGGSVSTEKSPLDLLKERFARGEIDEDEYKKRKQLLSE